MAKERIALVPGSFDPITLGHVDVIERAARLFDKVVVVVAQNAEKTYMFTKDQRLDIAKAAISHIENAEAVFCDGIVAELGMQIGATALIKGVRDAKDLEYEAVIAKVNKGIAPEIETVLLCADESVKSVSSTAVRKLISYGMPIEKYVGKAAAEVIKSISK